MFIVKKNCNLAILLQTDPSVGSDPSAPAYSSLTPTATDYIQALQDGLEMSMSREQIDKMDINTGLNDPRPTKGLRTSSGALSSYLRTHSSSAASLPLQYLLGSMCGALGNSRTEDSDGAVAAGVSAILTGDGTQYDDGDIIYIDNSAGEFNVVSSVSGDTINLLKPTESAVPDGTQIAVVRSFAPTDRPAQEFHVFKYLDNAVLETASGCKLTGFSLSNFVSGQLPQFDFSYEGRYYNRRLNQSPANLPTEFNTSEPPVIVNARIYQNGQSLDVMEFGMSVEQTVSQIKTLRGKTDSRATARTITGSFNPYQRNNSNTQFENFDRDASFSIFVEAYNVDSSGKKVEAVCIYLEDCTITEYAEGDADGVLQHALSFKAGKPYGKDDLKIGFYNG